LEAAVEAKKEGLVKAIGITSHTLRAPMIHKRSLEKFNFDSILMPYNYMLMQNPAYAADFEATFAMAQQKGVAIQIIKTNQRRPWDETQDDHAHFAATWYEPFNRQESINLAVHWAMARPGTFLNTSGDVHILPMFLEAASHFEVQPSDEAMRTMLQSEAAQPLWA
jgi:predicted aldo/keto reductase-like oxidoreductase